MRFPFFQKPIEKKKYYFALLLHENGGMGAIITIHGKKTSISHHRMFLFTNGWEQIAKDVDDLLFILEKESNCQISEILLFLYSHYVDHHLGQIKKATLLELKKLVTDLELKPIGYVECQEAILAYYQEKEKNKLTSILVEIGKSDIHLFVYKVGVLAAAKVQPRTDSIAQDISLALNHIKSATVLPTRMIVYDSPEESSEIASLFSFPWSEHLFIQSPRIEQFTMNKMMEGFSYILSLFQKEQVPVQKEQTHKKKQSKQEDVMGFVINQDVTKLPTTKDQLPASHLPSITQTHQSKKIDYLKTLRYIFVRAKNSLFNHSFNIGSQKYLILGISVAILVITIGIVTVVFFHSSTIVLSYPSKPINQHITFASDELEIQTGSLSAKLEESESTTGKKDVGEKSKGQVTLYNFEDKEKVISKGQTLANGQIQFTTDEEVKIPAATLASDASAKLPGKQKVGITAVEIGPESNLEKDKRLTLQGLSASNYFAITLDSLKGGTKKSIRTVAKKDVDNGKKKLLLQAQQKAAKQLEEQNNKQYIIFPSLTDFELRDITLSFEIGEESNSVVITAQGETTYRFVKRNVLTQTVQKKLEPSIDANYHLDVNSIEFASIEAQMKKNVITVSTEVKAKSYKITRDDDIKKAIAGASLNAAKENLQKQFDITIQSYTMKPPVFPFDQMIPFLKKNILLKKAHESI